MASSIGSSVQLETGPWQRAYWTGGPGAAQKFCVQRIAEIQEKLDFISSLLIQVGDRYSSRAGLEKLSAVYCEKITRYLPDRKFGAIDTHVLSRGRGERTRTPFNYPDFRHRFENPEKLREFFSSKIQMHQDALEMIRDASFAFPANAGLHELESAHSTAKEKWMARQNQSDLSQFLLPNAEMSPHELMGIQWAHEQGYKGEGASAFLIEKGIDPTHPALKEAISPLQASTLHEMKVAEHGSHVGGIIAARRSVHVDHDHIGVAPLATLEFISKPIEIEADKKGIYIANYSLGVEFPLTRFIENCNGHTPEMLNTLMALAQGYPILLSEIFEIIQAKATEVKPLLENLHQLFHGAIKDHYFKELTDALIINSIGNDGIVFSEDPALCAREAYLLDRLDLTIHVVNLQQNGLYPNSSSRLPGAELSHAAISAVGTDVLSTVPENDYKRFSGTSMAAPHVTGVALLLKAAFPTLSPAQIRECILKGATPIVLDASKTPHVILNRQDLAQYTADEIEYSQRFYGQGLLNAKGAIEYAEELVSTSDPQP